MGEIPTQWVKLWTKENISPKAITESCFKESSENWTRCDTSACPNVQFGT